MLKVNHLPNYSFYPQKTKFKKDQQDNKSLESNRHASSVSFGHIPPEFMFVRLPNFGRNQLWASKMSKTAEQNGRILRRFKQNLDKVRPFNIVLDNLARTYHGFFNSKANAHTFTQYINQPGDFGAKRTGTLQTMVEKEGRYSPYRAKIDRLFSRQPENVKKERILFNLNPPVYMGVHTAFATIKGKKIPLTQTYKNPINPHPNATPIMFWQHMDHENIPLVMEHIQDLYNDLFNFKNISDINLDKTNQKIAEIHWHFAQAAPYERGSAGIGDMLSKTLYEALGIQVSPWKEGIAPDLEALTTPLSEFKRNYANLFEIPPCFQR